MFKTIAIGCDHAAFEYKEKLVKFLEGKGYKVLDMGTDSTESCDYPIFADRVCNKHKGIRAAVVGDLTSCEFTRLHNDANVLCMGARIIAYAQCEVFATKFLETEFMGGKHKKRIDMFEAG